MAAGLGFKTFTTGEVLSAANVNGYLMQGINVFASAAARDTAITSPQEGQFAFTKDTNGLWYYDGAAWVASGATGDIEGVTAGIGISGGGTSGTVTITNSMATAIDAKGDLIAGTGADAFSRLAIGTNNQVLTADSTAATGMKWAAAAAGGKVLQVIQATTSTETAINTTTMTDTTITATITPSATTSRILVLVDMNYYFDVAATAKAIATQLVRGSTAIFTDGTGNSGTLTAVGATVIALGNRIPITYLDSPATTAATTYKVQANTTVTTGNFKAQSNSATSSIILLEIGA